MAEARSFRALREEGLAAYRELYEAVNDPDARERSAVDVEPVAPLPRPHAAMPLRVLLSLALALQGDLKPLASGPANSEGLPVSQRLRRWGDEWAALQGVLFPELSIAALPFMQAWREWRTPPGESPTTPGRISWSVLRRRAREVVAGNHPVAGPEHVFFALIRDWTPDLEPLLDEVEVDADALVSAAAESLPPGDGLSTFDLEEIVESSEMPFAEARERELSAELGGLATSSWTILGALLSAGLVPEVASELLRPAEERIIEAIRSLAGTRLGRVRPSRTISRDYWVDEDSALGHGIYADAIVEFIRHPETRPPLTIGIKAPWGAGKTSLMRMIRKQLDPDPERPLVESARQELTNQQMLKLLRRKPSTRDRALEMSVSRQVSDRSARATVWFNAWKYQSAEQIWAGLGHEIIGQLTARMSRGERERFWARLNLRRLDEGRIRRELYRALFDRLLSSRRVIIAVAAAAALAIVTLALPSSYAGAKSAGAGAFLVAVLGLTKTTYSRVHAFLDDGVSASYATLVREPDYEGQLGFLHLVHSDLSAVLDLAATEDRPVVVFIDDLDRCSWEVVAKVVEALNLFLAGDFPDCIFVIAMEPEVVAAHIQVAYNPLTQALDTPDEPPLGWRFLEKMVQLPLSLPPPEPVQVERYLDSLLGPAQNETEPDAEQLTEFERRLREEQPSFDDLPNAALQASQEITGREQTVIPSSFARSVLSVVGDRFTDNDEEVRAVVGAQVVHFSNNPREIKRLLNVFRFYAFIQVSRGLAGLSIPTLEQVAKLAVLAVRWPNLLEVFGRPWDPGEDERVLARLETLARGQPGDGALADWSDLLEQGPFSDRIRKQLASPALYRVLKGEPLLGESPSGFL
jgi:hypothetical protein